MKYLVDIPQAHLEPSNAVLQPYAGPSIHPIGQIKLKSTRSSYVETLTFQVINTSQPALLSVDASKKLGALSLDADFVHRCTWRAANETLTEQDITASAIRPPPALPVITKRVWPPYGALTMDFITQQCPSLFKGIGHLGPLVDFDFLFFIFIFYY